MVTLSNQESAKREAAEQQQVQGQRCPRRGWGGSREPADTRADIPHLIWVLSQYDWSTFSGSLGKGGGSGMENGLQKPHVCTHSRAGQEQRRRWAEETWRPRRRR